MINSGRRPAGSTRELTVDKIAAPASVPTADGPLAIPSGARSTGSVVKGEKMTVHGTGYAPN